MMRKTTAALAAALLVCAGPIQAQEAAADTDAGDRWIHVRVDEGDGAEVDVNLPLSLVDVALEVGQEEGFDGDDLRLDPEGDVTVEDLRRLWAELRAAGDGEFLDVRDGDERIRAYRRGDRVHVDVVEDGQEKVRIRMPAAIVDALLAGEDDRLDLTAAARELARVGDREVVRIRDGETRVRVWVDGSNAGDDGREGAP